LNTKKNIFFIASNLPSIVDAYDGDFILRHAQAIALRNNVYAVYAIETEMVTKKSVTFKIENNVHIYRIYLPINSNRLVLKYHYYQVVFHIFNKINAQHNIDIVHANIHWRAGFAALLLHKKYKIPYVLSEHVGYLNTNYYKKNSVAQYPWLKKYLSRLIFEKAKYVLPVSNYLEQWVKKFAPKAKTIVISNCVDTNLFYHQPKPPNNLVTFVHASMGWPEKNIDKIIEAAIKLKTIIQNFELHIYAPITPLLLQYIAHNNAQDYIKILKNIPHALMPKVLQQADALILYSTIETQGVIALEALCCGLPVIINNTGGTPEMATTHNAIVVDPGNMHELITAMQYIIENKNKYEADLIANDAKDKYGYEKIADDFESVYSE
jgi:glycosyltransferase involved in cell wall biosynthesis